LVQNSEAHHGHPGSNGRWLAAPALEVSLSRTGNTPSCERSGQATAIDPNQSNIKVSPRLVVLEHSKPFGLTSRRCGEDCPGSQRMLDILSDSALPKYLWAVLQDVWLVARVASVSSVGESKNWQKDHRQEDQAQSKACSLAKGSGQIEI